MREKWKWLVAFAAVALMSTLLFPSLFSDLTSTKPWNLPLSGRIIVLDPGHGGPDGGAVGGEAVEKDIALNVAKKLRDYLQQQGALVLMTRETDRDLASPSTRGYSRRKTEDLLERTAFVNRSNADLFISIHLNAIPSPRWRGAQTFYYGSFIENERLARFIQAELRRNLENTHRLAKMIDTVYLLKHAKIPGALVEVGFLSNPDERELLVSDGYQTKLAASIYKGVLRYFSNEHTPRE
ncbi:N-acetylmuramoyl-L-alanine amidase CwlD [Geobacillus sp. G4]|jgi:N-acetylmuramoyl-L-alanine amidase|uniref:Germination-specific N-acetylmuramoyl-L-alanine amidase (Cell wall hydrolase) (Autolysin) n=7 Tax=Geobacillus TaxID=129337 RepID=Q5L3Q3_GEOKA|nr:MULTISPECIES: N-acetylmuramoyl-L-alanine amidase CwlD [Geobacillus]AEV17487.1 Germination-specific N-acetylmuramoyl-L-alanine amidase [Geobacillus thermoleovorans CCB_US3_UF5]AMV09534.1 N-acetylmuramoyl-L-alanine amidase [Geobacillus thermoleovorans]AOL33159.1 N-acetylmuramoyl-L-alanine amidase CwlD [Geobacillus thermoleovorans]AUI36737.1 N-acetylmuramoyl-L-alanine amidase CwlD [[Bacillus] caldolyticus]AWO74245.1 N-acetylmuramoyl-L-alanine amidase CwlD [Geobacillus thermoleovorans]